MENHSSQSSNSDENRNSLPPFLQSQPLPWSQEQGNDSSSGQFLSILQRRALVIAGVSITLMTVVVMNLILNRELPIYEGNFRLLVEPVNDDSKVVDIVKDPNVTKSGLDYDSQIEVLKSPELMGEILRNLKTTYQDINYNSLMANFTISRLAQTKIIEVRYRSHNANQVKTVLDQIAEDYIEYSRERRQTKLRQGIQFVEKQLPSIQNRVDELQKELQTFRQKYDFFDPQIQSEQVVNRISSLSEERQVVNQQLAQARANLSFLQKKDGQVANLKDAALYQQLLAKLQELDVKIATESTRLQDSNPTIQTLKQQRSRLVPLLNQEARRFLSTKVSELTTQLKTLEVQSQELAKAEQKLERQRKQWPILARQYTELQRNLEVATESLNRFLSTRENLQIQISQTELGWQLLEAPSKPKFPISDSSLKRYLIPGIVGSIALGVGVAILLEKLDKTYHSSQTLKEEVKLPLLGNIPFEKQLESTQNYPPTWKVSILKSVSGLNIFRKKDQQDSSYSAKFLEALRLLYTNVQLVSGDRSITSLTITSAMEGDGKSTIAFHLAKVATEMGQRVLLVDANLRQPNIHNLSNLNNSRGLSNLILTNVAMNEAIRQLPSMNELSVITAGSIPPDPTKLLSSEEMKRLMMNFHHTFDLVIYDAPPVLELADVSLLAPHTDGILLVVRIDKTDSSMLQRTLEHLKTYRMNVLGMVGNGNKSNNRC
ncbi:MAG: polysaccharide biosynthesis tyrosine autokinase [Nostoc sp. GBBB01]|jgi:capsular exopolysaccharide synthesis family protein|uniref:non-specific protein-tyrosine kinase n=1 Tax=Nostoc punctiforme FACHB-252 TaxID=1357509 RepID=A0ABR8H1H2_NOSPU|nr:polysaccharide biosynthesis tyrosine autokinase [Nostoc punctiforme]MBD2609677.1 polysaccharide biosynthesis tyrosine autokinase [Nostoc punctiforme FACHB-252]MBL1200331.1 polysaccharide biosynthesis tyrosine autokinase [Nostoc sp. GBBB01]